MPLNYSASAGNNVIDGVGGGQFNTFHYLKKAIITARREQFFMPLASVVNMPKHFGKTIKVYEYVPLLDNRNVNNQGLDAAGSTITTSYVASLPTTAGLPSATATATHLISYAVEADATATAAAVNAIQTGMAVKTGAGPWVVTFLTVRLNSTTTLGLITALLAAVPTATYETFAGNLYGSSKDVGVIAARLPTLGEGGGRVNRVGFTRIERTGSITKFGFFHEFSKESMDFDTDAMLMDHLSRELMTGAVKISEDLLQRDLLASAGVTLFSGTATSRATMTGEGVVALRSVVSLANLVRLDQILTDNRTPKQTTIITGSRMVDTKVIPAARVMFVGSEVVPMLKVMADSFGQRAFIPVQHYADAGTVLNGEIGTIDAFRIIQVPDMMHWSGTAGGATVAVNAGYRASSNKYTVFPMLVVGDDSFTTIGFQTDGKTMKFDIMTKMPGRETADRTDPYGETGFSSIKWYYGMLVKRPERIAILHTIAPL